MDRRDFGKLALTGVATGAARCSRARIDRQQIPGEG